MNLFSRTLAIPSSLQDFIPSIWLKHFVELSETFWDEGNMKEDPLFSFLLNKSQRWPNPDVKRQLIDYIYNILLTASMKFNPNGLRVLEEHGDIIVRNIILGFSDDTIGTIIGCFKEIRLMNPFKLLEEGSNINSLPFLRPLAFAL